MVSNEFTETSTTKHKYTGQNLAPNVKKIKKKNLAAKLSNTDCPLKPSFGRERERKIQYFYYVAGTMFVTWFLG